MTIVNTPHKDLLDQVRFHFCASSVRTGRKYENARDSKAKPQTTRGIENGPA
jgi:hypothetical protein